MDVFVSDVHLCASRPDTTARFLDFLRGRASHAARLWIIGDLFEYWAGDDDAGDPFNRSICDALRALSDAGVAICFIAGNRDFLVGDGFARAAGLKLCNEPVNISMAGQATLIMHGDLLCTGDTDYQAFRAQVRSPDWRSTFLAQPLAQRKAQIEALRKRSESEKQRKSDAIMDVDASAVSDALRASGCTRLIHGHTHRPATHRFDVDGRACQRLVLPAWDEAPQYGGHCGGWIECNGTQCRLVLLDGTPA